ncbi:MAG: hypothetical protein COY66_06170 [Candidatus Kerfeldbacteria bacterium CG_4_10_14_0_8_um_filter_42_10]|uniref:Transposase IS200-like domain-containing protein n=1 Tax=Candidatus Kerfeldbacteria bacterium CG_4_10_14_0_8_um_filter_42_10 TaxID=2014248 RepID=A0A2M7RG05_9BACT|nr:MAG: hypothetical protein COY66_06170 [Candidatus Kerfeldbacteria bacterium CG_4_10_14_0_8_um_filter_42_10]
MFTNGYKKHIPFHLYLDEKIYFVTARTIKGKKLFNCDVKLNLLESRIKMATKKYHTKLHAWVVLANHYHLLFTLKQGIKLSDLIRFVNGGSSHLLNNIDNTRGRKIWWNYWDVCVRNEKDFWAYFNYIHYNPVKHGYAEAECDYRYSSYNYFKNRTRLIPLFFCLLAPLVLLPFN